MTYLERAAGVDPLSAIIQVNLGDALQAQSRFDDAAGRYRRAIEIDPLIPGPYGGLSMLAAHAMGNFLAAVPLAEKAVALDPDSPTQWLTALYWDWGRRVSRPRAATGGSALARQRGRQHVAGVATPARR